VTGEPVVPPSTLQQTLQRGSASRCLGRRRDGDECGMTVTASSGWRWCPKHDPERQHLLADEARAAARASHAPRLTPELEAWADSIDWSDEAGVHSSLKEAAVLVLKRGLTPAQAQAMAKLADLRLRQMKAPPKAATALEVVVSDFRDGTRSNGPASPDRAEPTP